MRITRQQRRPPHQPEPDQHPTARRTLGSWCGVTSTATSLHPRTAATTPALFNPGPGLRAAHAADKSPTCGMNMAAVKTQHPDPYFPARDTGTAA